MQLSTLYRYSYNRSAFDASRRPSAHEGGPRIAGARRRGAAERATTFLAVPDHQVRSRRIAPFTEQSVDLELDYSAT
jgi:hypothetical protein